MSWMQFCAALRAHLCRSKATALCVRTTCASLKAMRYIHAICMCIYIYIYIYIYVYVHFIYVWYMRAAGCDLRRPAAAHPQAAFNSQRDAVTRLKLQVPRGATRCRLSQHLQPCHCGASAHTQ
jgi:hypothetical protein